MQDTAFTRCDETLQKRDVRLAYSMFPEYDTPKAISHFWQTADPTYLRWQCCVLREPDLILRRQVKINTTTDAQLKPTVRLPHPSKTRHVYTSTSRQSPPGKDARQEESRIPNRRGTFAKRTSTVHAGDWVAHQITMKTSRLTSGRPHQQGPANTQRPTS